MSLKSTLKKVVQVVQIGGRGGGENLDKIQKNSNFFCETFPKAMECKRTMSKHCFSSSLTIVLPMCQNNNFRRQNNHSLFALATVFLLFYLVFPSQQLAVTCNYSSCLCLSLCLPLSLCLSLSLSLSTLILFVFPSELTAVTCPSA